jgi:hypothetical protein
VLICLTKLFPYFILNNNKYGEEQYVVLRGEREEGTHIFLGSDISKKWRTLHNKIIFKRVITSHNCTLWVQCRIYDFQHACNSFHDAATPSGPRLLHCRGLTITLRHTTRGRTPLDEWSARRRDLYLTTHNTHNRRPSISPEGFEPAIRTNERPQTHALDRAATGIGSTWSYT